MRSKIEQALSLRFPPLAVYYDWEPPAEAEDHHPLCSMLLLDRAAKGETVAITEGTCGCPGALEGLGLAPARPENFPGGTECFLRFLSIGNDSWDKGRAVISKMIEEGAPKIMITEFAEGEGFKKSPELVDQWLEEIPAIEPQGSYVVIRPLEDLEGGKAPAVVTLLADPDQLSALVVLANYARPGIDNVRIPFCAGCASIALYPFDETRQPRPRAVGGLTDISARFYLGKLLGRDIVSFSMPWRLFQEMEANASESFLSRFAWKTMTAR
jgi:uncharacterized protein (DUF169 family)